MEVKLAAWDRGNELSEVVSQLNAGLSEVPRGAPEHGLCHRGAGASRTPGQSGTGCGSSQAGWLQRDVPGQWLSRSLLETEVAVSA